MDEYSFTAGADFRAYAATSTGFSGRSGETLRNIFASDRTVLEAASDDGAIRSQSEIAGTMLAKAGSCYVKARQFNTASLPDAICSYDFYLRVLSGSPIPEREPNAGAPEASRSNGRGCRVIGPATAKNDIFAITVNRSHTIGVIVGVDLERGVPEWEVIAGSGGFAGSFIMTL